MLPSSTLLALDIGGVLIETNKDDLAELCHQRKLSLANIFDEIFWDFQKGLVSSTQFISTKAQQLEISDEEFEQLFCALVRPTCHTTILATLKFPYIFFSSINALHFNYFIELFNPSLFARNNSLLSLREKVLKPHRLFFEKLSLLKPKKSEIMVIDDDECIINQALELGFSARHYDGTRPIDLFLCEL